MAGRSVWLDPEVRALTSSFVCAADEVWRMKRKRDSEGDFFRLFCDKGHYRGGDDSNNTRQGIYFITPKGELLGSLNSRDPRQVLDAMRAALSSWEAMPTIDRKRPAFSTNEHFIERLESKYPEGGLVLRSLSRDLPCESAPTDWRADAWNQDFVWFTKDEALALATPGSSRASILSRFARTSLLDNVRGQTEAFEQQDVVESLMQLDPTTFENGIQHFDIKGSFRLDRPEEPAFGSFVAEPARGVDAKLLGFASFDTARQTFVKFEAVALGTRWGSTRFNGRHEDPGPSPLGWAFFLAGDSPCDRIAPAHLWDSYDW